MIIYIYEYFVAFVLAFIVAFSSTPIVRKIAFKVGAVDVPKDNRRMHKKPIARLGGLAIVLGFLVSIMFYTVCYVFNVTHILFPDNQFFLQLIGLLAGVLIIVAMGIIDDIKQLKAKIKLIFQLIAAIAAVLPGTRIEYVTNPFSQLGLSQLNIYISYILTILWIVGITNAINLIDGLDGLAAGVSSIAYLSLFVISVIRPDGTVEAIALIAAILAGSTLGFLPFNFNPAKIFMGDTGSTFLGYTLGVISIMGTLKSYTTIAIAIPLLVLGLPLFDTIFAILRRLLKGKSIMEADRGHLHHRLIDMGLSHKQSVAVMYIASAALGLCAIVLAERGVLSAIILVIAVSVFVVGGARYMNEINKDYYEEEYENADEPLQIKEDGESPKNDLPHELDTSEIVNNQVIK